MYFLRLPSQDLLHFILSHWTSLLWGAVVLVVIKMIWWYGQKTERAIRNTFPHLRGPKPVPFLGFLPEFAKHSNGIHLLLDKYYKLYGRVFTMAFARGKPALVVCDPKMLREIFVKNFDCFYDRPVPFELPEPLDSFLSIVRGERWKRIRNTLSPTFTAHNMKSMVPLINVPCDTLMKKIEKAAETGETFDIVKYQQAVTVEIILSIVFGIQSDCQMNPDDPLMARALEAMQPTPFKQLLFNVILPILPLGSYFTQSEMGAKYIFSSMYDLASFTRSVINERKELKTSRKDLLDLMLKAADPSNKSDKRLTEDEVVSQCIIFFLGGYETTSTTLALTCHNIATHPDVQLKLQQEIDSVWTDEDQMPSYDTVHNLPYLDMVISETLRMYPPGTLLTRTCMKECTIQGIRIPKGCDIFVTSYSMQRDPRNYPDPEKFDPERFNPEAKQARDPYTYLPFGHGPRDCIGKRFAFMEMKLVLSRILRRYDIKTTPETEIPPNVGVKNTLSVIGGVKVAVSPRVKNG